MPSLAFIVLKLGGGIALIVFGTLAAGAGLFHSNNLLLLASGVQFLVGISLLITSAGNLRNPKSVNLDRQNSGANDSTGKTSIARWAELATSQSNAWMNAISLHESGRYEEAWVQYLFDALNCSADDNYSKAELSLTLAADCLKSINQPALARKTSELAQRFHANKGLASRRQEEIQTGTSVEDLSNNAQNQSVPHFSFRAWHAKLQKGQP